MKSLIETIARIGEISEEDAQRVAEAYLAAGVATNNVHDGARVKHGFWLEQENILGVLENLNKKE